MAELEKVLKGLECWSHMAITCDSGCLYRPTYEREKVVGECDFQALCIDALELLKAREPRVLTWEELINVTDPVWYEERDGISSWALCTYVTRGNAYEDMSYEFFANFDNSYNREYANNCNVYWRCWTAKPTDKQREAVKWE